MFDIICLCSHQILDLFFWKFFIFLFLFLFIYLFAASTAAPMAYGGPQARGLIGDIAAGLCQNHSNAESELHLRPTPQLMATPDP